MKFAALLLLWVCFVPFAVVHGADGYDGTAYPYDTLVTETGDYFVVIEQPSTFTAETDLCVGTTNFWCAGTQDGGNFTDSALWLYADNGALLTSNDDDPRTNGQSYQSFISVSLEAGVYRLRAGRFSCHDGSCLWPQDPFPVGGSYQLLTTAALLRDPNPPEVNPTAIPSILPTPEPTQTPEPTPSPTPTQTPEPPSPSPSVAPSPTPEPSVTPPPTPEPTPEPTAEPPPTPEPTPTPTEPPPTVAPTQEPTNEPPPNPTATPQPTPEGTVEPSPPASPPPTPDPTAVPPPEPTQPPLPNLEEVAAAVEEAVGESIAAIGGGIADIAAIGEIGKDLDATEKEEAQPMAVAVISSQIASVTAAAASAARGGGSTPSGGNLGGGGGGGADAPKTRKTSSRKEQK